REVYSFHPGGANVVFADGRVHFLKTTIDIRVFARLVTRAGGEIISAGDYFYSLRNSGGQWASPSKRGGASRAGADSVACTAAPLHANSYLQVGCTCVE